METGWTLDELVHRVGLALAGASQDGAYPGPPNGRVRGVPDRRMIRWYTTIGLVDRPLADGRIARYGPRHLLQLVAIKRRQAQGRSLAEIQAELVGAGDETLAAVARVPDRLLAAGPSQPAHPDGGSPGGAHPDGAHPDGDGPVVAPAGTRPRFWAAAPDSSGACAEPGARVLPGARVASEPADADRVGLLTGVPLGGGATLLLPGVLDDTDLAAIMTAAAPLLDVLTARGLLGRTS